MMNEIEMLRWQGWSNELIKAEFYRNELRYWLSVFGYNINECARGEYYVYLAFNTNDELVYVGSGKGFRDSHVNSGISHNKELNKMHFSGEKLFVHRFLVDVSKEDALRFEKAIIRLMNPAANTIDKVQNSLVRNWGSLLYAYFDNRIDQARVKEMLA